MYTAAQLVKVLKLQSAFGVLALLNMYGHLYPKDLKICDGDTYDYIVVGGGASGVIVAARLAEADYSTLIIEAGGNPGLENDLPGMVTYIRRSRMDWKYTSESDGYTGQCHKEGGSLYSKVLGGSGATNFMLYGRGFPSDYDKISKVANDSSWNFKHMLKYFKKTEKLQSAEIFDSKFRKYHSSEGTIGVTKENRPICDDYLKGFEQAGEPIVVDNIGAGILGYSTGLYNIYDGVRTEGASAYLPPLKDNPNLQITRNSLATKIIFDKKKNAVGVEFVKDGKTITVKAREEVIVSAGPTKSPQLLMLSGIGPKKELKHFNINVISDLPVGKSLQNSVGALLVFKTNKPANPEPFNVHKFPAPLIVGHSTLNKSSRNPEYATLNFIMDDADYFLAFCGFTLGMKNSICDRLYLLAKKTEMLVAAVRNPNIKSRGEIQLNSSNPFDQPKIINGYFSNDDDLDTLVSYIMDYMKIESTSQHFKCSLGLKFLNGTEKCDKFKFGSRTYWRCYVLCMMTNFSNKCGTCSMGAVVDNKLRVLGVNRLRVIDASVIPNTIGSPMYPLIAALGEKAADMILENM